MLQNALQGQDWIPLLSEVLNAKNNTKYFRSQRKDHRRSSYLAI